MSEGYAYVGILDCGCMVCAVSGDPSFRKHAATEVARWMREGLRIERVSDEVVRQKLHRCTHKVKKPPATEQLPLDRATS